MASTFSRAQKEELGDAIVAVLKFVLAQRDKTIADLKSRVMVLEAREQGAHERALELEEQQRSLVEKVMSDVQ